MLFVAGLLGVSSAVANAVVSIILTGSTVISIILAITTILSGGLDAILTVGWTALITTVKEIAKKKGVAAAVAY